VTLIYDSNRGGFFLEFVPVGWGGPCFHLFDRMMSTQMTKERRVGIVNGSWDHGGLLLNALYKKPGAPYHQRICGPKIGLTDGLTQSGEILVKQDLKAFEIWFGSMPLLQPPTNHDANTSVSVWFAAERVKHPYFHPPPESRHSETQAVLGIRVAFSHLAAA